MNHLSKRHQEIIAAAPDALAIQAGIRVERPHPLARDLSLKEIAVSCALASSAFRQEHDPGVVAAGMTTADFSQILLDGFGIVTTSMYHAQAEHLQFVSTEEVKNFNPTPIGAIDIDVTLDELSECQEINQFNAVLSESGLTARLTSFGKLLTVTREAVYNNQIADIGRLFAASGLSVARLESRLVAAAMEGNPVMKDQLPVFGADFLNELPGEVFSGIAVGKAMSMLRKQLTASGHEADLRARHLVVEPDLEFYARTAVQDLGVEITVSVLASLPAGRWFLLADPAVCPTVGVLRLFGEKTPVRLTKPTGRIHKDGTHTRVIADVGACLLRRNGIVRGG
ncbi:MAG: hypothetical protein CVU21_22385 [Betaproteobacteria bacterium HGW-Betaproteobacteria-15]|nr:MAG: hypothetical protein CVU21_22385 [Betaproteobacteria bacterium HGW-Betaproteobacteria-15]